MGRRGYRRLYTDEAQRQRRFVTELGDDVDAAEGLLHRSAWIPSRR